MASADNVPCPVCDAAIYSPCIGGKFHPERVEALAFERKNFTTDSLASWKQKYTKCRVCGDKVDFATYCNALSRKEPRTCSSFCSRQEREVQNKLACCNQAKRIKCVCNAAFECPEHGRTHHGTHD